MCEEHKDYVDVMRRMLAEASKAPAIYQPGPFWKPHAERMITAVERHGIENFRRIQDKALTAFNTGNHWQPAPTRTARLLRTISRLPIIERYAAAVQRDIDTGYIRARSEGTYKLRAVYYWLKDVAPDLLELPDKLIGNPVTFSIDGREFSEVFLLKLLDLSLLRKYLDFSSINSVIEVGGSYGLFGELMLMRYPHLSYTLVDIAPVAGFAEYYLGQSMPGSARVDTKCAYQLPKIDRRFDLFVNVGSFQEMSREQVALYCDFAHKNAAHVYLNNNVYSPQNEMTQEDYERLLGMDAVASWPSPLHANYRPVLLKKCEDRLIDATVRHSLRAPLG